MEIKPNRSVRLHANTTQGDMEFALDPVYDRIDRFRQLGFNILKIVDPQRGFAQLPLEDETAALVAIEAHLPVVDREFITESEYELYLNWCESNLDEWLED